MKNPLEFTLLEVEAMMQGNPDAPHSELTRVLAFLHYRLKYMRDYQVEKVREQIRAKKDDLTKRALRSIEQDLLDNAEIVTSEFGPENSQAPTGAK